MALTSEELIAQLSAPDSNTRAIALDRLVQLGARATPTLVDIINHEQDEQVRVQSAQALAEIADPASADTLAAMVNDPHGDIRARGAQGLARINDPRAVDALISTINDFPDVLHHPYTLSTYILIDRGKSVLPRVAPLLTAPDADTRVRAALVTRAIAAQLPEVQRDDTLRQQLETYDPYGPEDTRAAIAEQWSTWLNQQVQE